MTKQNRIAWIPLPEKDVTLLDLVVVHLLGDHGQFAVIQHGEKWDIHDDVDELGLFLGPVVFAHNPSNSIRRVEGFGEACLRLDTDDSIITVSPSFRKKYILILFILVVGHIKFDR